jgi:hypothetical protein
MPTHRERIAAYLQVMPEGADDDQIAAALGLPQRQTANQECRLLECTGRVVRLPHPQTGKLVNHWVHT